MASAARSLGHAGSGAGDRADPGPVSPRAAEVSRTTVYPHTPAVLTWEECARYAFRRAAPWLRMNLPPDFPRAHPVYNVFLKASVDEWLRNTYESGNLTLLWAGHRAASATY